jgi:hypothetical protein
LSWPTKTKKPIFGRDDVTLPKRRIFHCSVGGHCFQLIGGRGNLFLRAGGSHEFLGPAAGIVNPLLPLFAPNGGTCPAIARNSESTPPSGRNLPRGL